MIIKGNQRGGGQALAAHLMNARDNDHVELHDMRGFMSGNLLGAFLEVEAAANGTKCRQPFFSVSLNPPKGHNPTIAEFERAMDLIEAKIPALKDQPRSLIFHEKEGRRHAHAVWSRITERGPAVQLSHSREKLRDVSRAMYAAMGIEAPAGIRDRTKSDPLNYDLSTWQQAKRMGEDPRDLKAIIQEAWTHSDDRASFERVLAESALTLARGDKRGFVVLDHSGEALSLTRYTGLKSKDLKARLGPPEQLPTVDQARVILREKMLLAVPPKPGNDMRRRHREELRPLSDEHRRMKDAHRQQRQALDTNQTRRAGQEAKERAARLRKGVMGLWDRLSGKRGKISEQNAREMQAGKTRDRAERQTLIETQMQERGELQGRIVRLRDDHRRDRKQDRTRTAFGLSLLKDDVRADFMNAMHRIEDRKKNPPTAAQMRRERAEKTDTMPVIITSERTKRADARRDRQARKEAENSPGEGQEAGTGETTPENEQAPAASPEQAQEANSGQAKEWTAEERAAAIEAERQRQADRDRGSNDNDPGRTFDPG